MKGLRRPKAVDAAPPKGLKRVRLAAPKPPPRQEADKTTVPASYEQLAKAAG